MHGRTDRPTVMNGRAAFSLLVALTSLCVASIRAQDATIQQLAQGIENRLLSPPFCYDSIDRVTTDFQSWQLRDLPIAPPDPNFILYAQRDTLRVFAPTGFPATLVSGLIAEPYRDMTHVYRVTVYEDPTTRERVFYNANTNEIWRQAAPENYDPWAFLRNTHPWALEQNTAAALKLRRIYDPARIRCEYLLLPTTNVPDCALACAIETTYQAIFQNAYPLDMLINLCEPASSDFVFTDLLLTNGIVDAAIHLPEGIACRVDLFNAASLPGFPWSLLLTTPTNTEPFRIQVPCTLTNAFFAAGNADIDTDGDGIPDDRELLMHGTDPDKRDTDGDTLSDYDELMTHGTNPLLRDSDADGMDDDEELFSGNNPIVPNGGASATSIRYYYDADGRLLGAFSALGGGAVSYPVTPAGNLSPTAERSAP